MDNTASTPASWAGILSARRRELRITQVELALLAGVSTRSVVALEHGKPTIRTDTLLAVLDALGLEIDIRPRRAT